MRRTLIGTAIVLTIASGLVVAIERYRPALLPGWARLAYFEAANAPRPDTESPVLSGLEEDAPDDGWRAYLKNPDSSAMKSSLPTIRLASVQTAEQVGLQTVAAGLRTIAPTVSGNAEIAFVAHDYAHITSRVSGWVSQVPTDEGRWAKKGDVLVVVNSAEVGSAKAHYLGILPNVDIARKEFARTSNLLSSGAATNKDELALQTALTKAEAELLNARQRLRNMGFSDGEIGRIAVTKDTGNELKILAPISGRLVERHAVIGEAVTPPIGAVNSGQMLALFDIADPSEMWAWIDIGESDVEKVAIGQKVTFTISGTVAPVFSGTVDLVSYSVNTTTRTVRVRADLKNIDERLRANQYGRAVIAVGPERRAVVVPRSAVQADGGEEFVFRPLGDRRYRTQRVKTQPTDRSDEVEVVFGLQAGDQVVTTGSFLLKSELLRSKMASSE